MSFSGRCLLSNYMVGRDANRGECAQPCRWGYYLMEEKRPGQYFPIFEDEKGSYILNAKDMCMIEYIDKVIDAGVTSLKIEGRAKSFYYVAVVTNAYRQAVDLYKKDPKNFKLPSWIEEETRKVSHRQYSTGFYFGRPEQGRKRDSTTKTAAMSASGMLSQLWTRPKGMFCTAPRETNSRLGKKWRSSVRLRHWKIVRLPIRSPKSPTSWATNASRQTTR